MTTTSRKYPTSIEVKHDRKTGWIVISQIRTIDKQKIMAKYNYSMGMFSLLSGGRHCVRPLYRYFSREGKQVEYPYHFLNEEYPLKKSSTLKFSPVWQGKS